MTDPPLTRVERILTILIVVIGGALFWFAIHTHQGILR